MRLNIDSSWSIFTLTISSCEKCTTILCNAVMNWTLRWWSFYKQNNCYLHAISFFYYLFLWSQAIYVVCDIVIGIIMGLSKVSDCNICLFVYVMLIHPCLHSTINDQWVWHFIWKIIIFSRHGHFYLKIILLTLPYPRNCLLHLKR